MTPNVKSELPAGTQLLGPAEPGWRSILSLEAITFVNELAERFGGEVESVLLRRERRQAQIDAGELPDFLPETAGIRESDWKVATIPQDLLDRRVEITGPTDRKMVINAFNSGARVFMADCEDSLCPTWSNVVEGQVNLIDAIEGTIAFASPDGKHYRLGDRVATLLVRPRGFHLVEKHVWVDGRPVAGAFFDFGLYVVHNARRLAARFPSEGL